MSSTQVTLCHAQHSGNAVSCPRQTSNLCTDHVWLLRAKNSMGWNVRHERAYSDDAADHAALQQEQTQNQAA